MCAFCGSDIVYNNETDKCEFCLSKNFLIENQFAHTSIIAQGGQGRIFKSLHKTSNTPIVIKERLIEEVKVIIEDEPKALTEEEILAAEKEAKEKAEAEALAKKKKK